MKNKSFTLIELLVVIVIIGILAGVIMISTSSSIDKASIAKVKVFEENVANNLAANMVSRWKLDGNTSDSWGSNNGNSLNINYGQSYNGTNDSAAIFNGTNGYINCGNIFNEKEIKHTMTASLWFKTNIVQVLAGDAYIISKKQYSLDNSAFGIHVGSGNVYWSVHDDANTSATQSASFEINKWINIVGSWNNGLQLIYFNGQMIASNTRTFKKINDSSSVFLIGAVDNAVGDHYFQGSLSDVKIFDSALSSSQIKQNYIAGLNSMLSNGNISNEEYNERINELAYDK